ncbi:MAG TPA: AfsR/SARP family transcriptional regulator, partial [Microlunatus sp.]
GVTWPYALIDLAFAKAELARLGGRPDESRRQLTLATNLLGDTVDRPPFRAQLQDRLGYLADDLQQARAHRTAAWQAASEAGVTPLMAQVLVGIADLALRLGRYEQAARLLAASVQVRGMPDRSHPDADRIEQTVRSQLGEQRFTELTEQATNTNWPELVDVTLAS